MSNRNTRTPPPKTEEVPRDWQVVHQVDPENFRVYLVVRYLSFLGIGAHGLFIPMFFWLGVPALAAFNIASVGCWILARRRNESGQRDAAIRWITFEVVGHAVAATCWLGLKAGFHNYLLPLIPFMVFNQRIPARVLRAVTSGLCGLYLALCFLAPSHAGGAPGSFAMDSMFLLNTLVIFSALGMMSYYFRQASVTAERSMAQLANHDALTGLPNRRRLIQVLEAESERAQREGHGFMVAIGDIDHFKQFNDQHGHDCGDAVLKAVAGVLRGSLRHDDTAGRWGGEEFLLVVRHPDGSIAAQVVERFRKNLESHIVIFEEKSLSVTMTLGLVWSDGSQPLDDVIKRADEALYEGKGLGRNRVVQAPPSVVGP